MDFRKITRKSEDGRRPWWVAKIPFLERLWENPVFQLNYRKNYPKYVINPGTAFRIALTYSLLVNFLNLYFFGSRYGEWAALAQSVTWPANAIIIISALWLFIRCLISTPLDNVRSFKDDESNPIFTSGLTTREIYYGCCMPDIMHGLVILESLCSMFAGLFIPYFLFFELPKVFGHDPPPDVLNFLIGMPLDYLMMIACIGLMTLVLSLTGGIYSALYRTWVAVTATLFHYLFISWVSDLLSGFSILGHYPPDWKEFLLKIVIVLILSAITARMGINAFETVRRKGHKDVKSASPTGLEWTLLVSPETSLSIESQDSSIRNAERLPSLFRNVPFLRHLWGNPIFQRRYIPFRDYSIPQAFFAFGMSLGAFGYIIDIAYGDMGSEGVKIFGWSGLALAAYPLVVGFAKIFTDVPINMVKYGAGREPVFETPVPLSDSDYLEGEAFPDVLRYHNVVSGVLHTLAGIVVSILVVMIVSNQYYIWKNLGSSVSSIPRIDLKELAFLLLALWILANIILAMTQASLTLAWYSLRIRDPNLIRLLGLLHTGLIVYLSFAFWKAIALGFYMAFIAGHGDHGFVPPDWFSIQLAFIILAVLQLGFMFVSLIFTYRMGLSALRERRFM